MFHKYTFGPGPRTDADRIRMTEWFTMMAQRAVHHHEREASEGRTSPPTGPQLPTARTARTATPVFSVSTITPTKGITNTDTTVDLLTRAIRNTPDDTVCAGALYDALQESGCSPLAARRRTNLAVRIATATAAVRDEGWLVDVIEGDVNCYRRPIVVVAGNAAPQVLRANGPRSRRHIVVGASWVLGTLRQCAAT